MKTMRYAMYCALRGDVKKFQKKLVNDISKKFNLTFTKRQAIPAHFTLKYPFETKKIKEVERVVAEFCKKHKKTPVKIKGFSSFPPNTIFLNVKLSKKAKNTFKEFIREMRKLKWMTWNQFDAENLHFHATIAEKCGEKYNKVMTFLKGKERTFNCSFDNITILRQTKVVDGIDMWKEHKKFKMK